MADFTVEVREMAPQFFAALEDYPIYDEAHREELNSKLYRHYKYREIGFETIDLFVDRLRTRMHEIMPPINDLYRSAAINYDPLEDVNVRTESVSHSESVGTGSANSSTSETSNGSSTTQSDGRTQSYEMPQTANFEGQEYATSAGDSVSQGSGTTSSSGSSSADNSSHSTSTGDGTTDSWQHGRTRSAQSLVQEYRDTIINIDMMVVDGVSDLFMTLWSANTPYTQEGYYNGWLPW